MDAEDINAPSITLVAFPSGRDDLVNRMMQCIGAGVREATLDEWTATGGVSARDIDDDLRLPWLVWMWILDANEIIENLNLTIGDLWRLPKLYPLWFGPPHTRYYLLIRTYFYEFYRFREQFGIFTKRLQRRGVLPKSDLAEVRTMFHEAFKPTIELRNALVHGDPRWIGRDHFELTIVAGAEKAGFSLVDKVTGNHRTVADVLARLCRERATWMVVEGNRMAAALQSLAGFLIR